MNSLIVADTVDAYTRRALLRTEDESMTSTRCSALGLVHDRFASVVEGCQPSV